MELRPTARHCCDIGEQTLITDSYGNVHGSFRVTQLSTVRSIKCSLRSRLHMQQAVLPFTCSGDESLNDFPCSSPMLRHRRHVVGIFKLVNILEDR